MKPKGHIFNLSTISDSNSFMTVGPDVGEISDYQSGIA